MPHADRAALAQFFRVLTFDAFDLSAPKVPETFFQRRKLLSVLSDRHQTCWNTSWWRQAWRVQHFIALRRKLRFWVEFGVKTLSKNRFAMRVSNIE